MHINYKKIATKNIDRVIESYYLYEKYLMLKSNVFYLIFNWLLLLQLITIFVINMSIDIEIVVQLTCKYAMLSLKINDRIPKYKLIQALCKKIPYLLKIVTRILCFVYCVFMHNKYIYSCSIYVRKRARARPISLSPPKRSAHRRQTIKPRLIENANQLK